MTDGTVADSGDQFANLAVPDGVQISSLTLNGQLQDQDQWQLKFFRDGTTTDACVELSEAGRYRTLDIYSNGSTQWREGVASDRTATTWTAGSLAQRP